jgi:hypothetical protein
MANDAKFIRFAWRAFGELSAIILVPALVALLAARALEAHGVSLVIVFALVAVAFALTILALVNRTNYYGKMYEKLLDEQKKGKRL